MSLPESILAGATGHVGHHNSLHALVNDGIANANIAAGAAIAGSKLDFDLGDAGDVDPTGVAEGDVLRWDGAAWERAGSQVFHVANYGAVGAARGTATASIPDETVELQDALDAIAATTGPAILLLDPTRDYKITAALDIPYMQHKRIGGGGAIRTARIIQATDDVPILQATFENTHSIAIDGLALEYANLQTGNTSAAALAFNVTSGIGSGFYHWDVHRLYVRNAYNGVGLGGSGSVSTWDMAFRDTHFSAIVNRVFSLSSPVTIGMPVISIERCRVINTGTAAHQATTGTAFKSTAVELRISHLDIEGWKDRVLEISGTKAPVVMEHVHIEHHLIDATSNPIIFSVSDGPLFARQMSISAEVTGASGTVRLFKAQSGGATVYTDGVALYLDNTIGRTVRYCEAGGSNGAWIRGVEDAGTGTAVAIPTSAADTTTWPKIRHYEPITGVQFFGNCDSAPGSNPVGGVNFYADSGSLKVRTPSGTIATLASDSKPAVTGTGTQAALGSLLTQLAGVGLLTDSSTTPTTLGVHATSHARGGADLLTAQAGDFAPARLGTTALAAETMPRWASGTQLTPTAGALHLMRITLAAGSYTTVTFCKSTIQGATLTNTYFALYDATSLARLGVSADISTAYAAVAANTDGQATLNTTISTAGDYYLGLLVATAVTMPTLLGAPVGASALGYRTPVVTARHNTGSLTAAPDPVVLSNPGGLLLLWFRYE